MKRKIKSEILIVTFVFIASLAVSCNSSDGKSDDVIHPTPTGATQPHTLSPNTTEVPTQETESTFRTNCQKIVSEQLKQQAGEEGTIIFEGECEGKNGLFKLSNEYQKITPFLSDVSHGVSFLGKFHIPFYVSEDHQWLSYQYNYYDLTDKYLGSFLIVTGEDEKSLIQYPVNRNWYSLMGWYDGLISYSLLRAPDLTIDLLNPASGKVTQYHYQYNWAIRREIFLDPPIARVFYFDDLETNRYLLKEIVADKLLWQSTENPLSAGQPQWSSNGLLLAAPVWDDIVNGKFKFLIINSDGKEFDTLGLFQAPVGWSYVPFQWSPSGKYLSFWVQNETSGKKLMVWDVSNNQFIDSEIKAFDQLSLPVFSPSEQYFILAVAQNDGTRVNYLVDLQTNQIVTLKLNLSPVAWLKLFEPGQPVAKPVNEPEFLRPEISNKVDQQHLSESALIPTYDGGIVYFRDQLLYTLTTRNEKNETLIDEHQLMDAFVSPDSRSVFFWYKDKNDNFTPHYFLSSLHRQNTEVITNSIDPSDDAIFGWFNNNELWVSTKDASRPLLFDPFETTFHTPPKFKDPQMAGCIDWTICSYIIKYLVNNIDTKFEREIFITSSNIYMMDREANFLWQYENWLITLNLPKWSPNEQHLGVPLPLDDAGEHYEFFIINRDGKSKQLTSFLSAYPTLTVDQFQWSPNGELIAFWADTRSQTGLAQRNPYRLFVLNTVTGQTTDYCVTGKYSNNIAPIWSPNGSQIAINTVRDGRNVILFIDIKAGTVSPLIEGELVGWLKTP